MGLLQKVKHQSHVLKDHGHSKQFPSSDTNVSAHILTSHYEQSVQDEEQLVSQVINCSV